MKIAFSVIWVMVLELGVYSVADAQITVDTIGTSSYIAQAGGPAGTRIVVDNFGGSHISWMSYWGGISTRKVIYNCRTSNQWVYNDAGVYVDTRPYIGYEQLAVLSDRRAIIAYYYPVSGNESTFVAIDSYRYLGQFVYSAVPNRFSDHRSIHPYLTIDRNDRIHVTTSEKTDIGDDNKILFYSSSSDAGDSWSSPVIVDTGAVGSILTASKVSDKVAIIHTRLLTSDAVCINLKMVESEDGIEWDFVNNQVEVTSYPGEDSLYPANDYDAIYDYNDNLHLVWFGQKKLGGQLQGPVYLYHYDRNSGTISEIVEYEPHFDSTCTFHARLYSLNMVSIGCTPGGNLYVSYSRFNPDDCSRDGIANGEIYVQYSTDGGVDWSQPVNISNTPTPDCADALCLSEIWPSMAERVDGFLYLTCTLYNGDYDLSYFENPVVYIKYPVAELGAGDSGEAIPNHLKLSSYPNPFNSQTMINYSVEKPGKVTLEIFDLLGRKVATLLDAQIPAGESSTIWNATEASSGVYYCRLSSAGVLKTNRLILIK